MFKGAMNEGSKEHFKEASWRAHATNFWDEDCGAVHCCFLLSLLSDHTKSFNLRIGNDRVSGQLFICSEAQKRRIQRMEPWVLLSICTGTIGFLYWWFVDFNTGEVELNFKKVLLPGPLQNQQAQESSQEDVAETWKRFYRPDAAALRDAARGFDERRLGKSEYESKIRELQNQSSGKFSFKPDR